MNKSRSSSSRRRKRSASGRTAPQPPLDQLGQPLALENPFDSLLLSCVDFGFAVLILLMPFVMGGREAPGQLLLVLTACWLSACWGLLQFRQRDARWTLSLAEPLILGGVGLVVLQIVRLPAEQLSRLSPKLPTLLHSWQGTGVFPVWDRISFMPMETLDSLIVLVAYALIFIVALQRIRTQKDAYRLLTGLGIATVLMAAFGLLQYATSNGRFFWFYENPFTDTDRVVKGAFTNRNHFANFMALGIGPLLWCLTAISVQARLNDDKTGFQSKNNFGMGAIIVALSVVLFAGLLSLSRGGAIAMGIASVICCLVLYRSAIISGQLAIGGVCVLILTCGMIAAYGEDQIQKRLDQIASADVEKLDSSDGRRNIWAANIEGIKEFQLVGTGIGTHRDVYPMYMESSGADGHKSFTHAENGYLQVGLESGGIGLGLLLLAFLLAMFWTTRGLTRRDRPLIAAAQAAALGSILASLAHSGSDFVWYVPACVVPVILLSAAACRLRQLQNEEVTARYSLSLPLPRLAWTLAGVGTIALAVWMVPAKFRRVEAQRHWYEYQRMSQNREESQFRTVNETMVLRNRLISLSRAIKADPSFARPHFRMAGLCLRAFHELQSKTDNPMALGIIRDAAVTGDWDSKEQMHEWMGRVFEERQEYLTMALQHARQGLELCPLEGRAYLYLAELDFIDRENEWNGDELIAQAITVRPHHPQVLFASGQSKLLSGQVAEGVELWKKAFTLSRDRQVNIISQLALIEPAPNLIRTFEPGIEALAHMTDRYRQLQRWPDVRYSTIAFTDACFKQAEDPETPQERSIRFLLVARKACDFIRDQERAQQCLVKAIELDPRDYRTHYQYGVWLADRQQFEGAAAEFAKCSEIRPGDDKVRRLSVAMRRKQLDIQLQRKTRMATPPTFRRNL